MTDSPFLSAPRALQLPELLVPIGSYLDPSDLSQCVQVCHHWNQCLIPALWQTIDDQLYSWPTIFKYLSNTILADQAEEENWIRYLFVKHGHHIWNLRANRFVTIVIAQSAGTCVNLRTLAATGQCTYIFQEARMLQNHLQGCTTPKEGYERLVKSLISPIFKEQLYFPPYIPKTEQWYQKWVFVQRFWLLIFQNPQLQGFHLGKDLPHAHSNADEGFILKALTSLPNLTRLDTHYYDSSFTFRAILERLPQLQHFASRTSLLIVSDIDRTFSHIRSIRCSATLRLQELFILLDHLPNLGQLWINGLQKLPPLELNNLMENVNTITTTNRLSELCFTNRHRYVAERMIEPLEGLVLRRLPCLTTLTLRALYSRTAASLSMHCPKLERFQLLDHGHFFHTSDRNLLVNVVVDLLRQCSHLKVLDAIGHTVEAEYLLGEPWVCQGLEVFRCQVIGMNRLTIWEQDFYKLWETKSDRKEQDKELSTEEQDVAKAMEIANKHRRCQELHGRVYDRLAEMSRLRVLDFGKEVRDPFKMFGDSGLCEVDGRDFSTYSPPISNTLELSLESGLPRLGALKNLEVFGFENVDHRIGNKELVWMAKSWPRLRIMRGLQNPSLHHMMHNDSKTLTLKEQMEELRPFVRHEAIGDKHPLSVKNESHWSSLILK